MKKQTKVNKMRKTKKNKMRETNKRSSEKKRWNKKNIENKTKTKK